MDQLVDLMDAGELDIELSEGFGPRQFIEVKEPVAVADSDGVPLSRAGSQQLGHTQA